MPDNDSSKTFLCKYVVASMVMMLGDQRLELDPSNILSIDYFNNYDSNLRAILKVTVRVDVQRKLWLLQNKRDIVVKFELNKIGMDADLETYITSLEPVWNNEFNIYFNDEDESIDTSVLEKRLEMNSDSSTTDLFDSENYFESQNLLDIYLFNQALLDASNTIVNEVFTAGTLQEFVGYLCTKTKHDHLLMSRFDNTEVYKELLVPALPAYKAFIYLDQYYGFHKTGSIIYYDLDTLYILNANGKLTAKRGDEWSETVLMVMPIDNSVPGNAMIRREGEKVFYVSLNAMNVNPQKMATAGNETVGSIAKFVITDGTEFDISEADQTYTSQKNTYIGYIRKDDNRYSAQWIKARMEENDCVMYVDATNLDLTAFTPNKVFRFVYTDPTKQARYGNYKYRLSFAQHLIRRESMHYMSASHRLIFKKCQD